MVGQGGRARLGDIWSSLAASVAHYEERGDWVLRMLGQEQSDNGPAY